MISSTERSLHKDDCPYSQWYDDHARWQPRHPLSEVVRETMAEYCTCEEKEVQRSMTTINVTVETLRQLVEVVRELHDRLEDSHYKCDTDQDIDCSAEQYGDGNAREHERLRELRALIKEVTPDAA